MKPILERKILPWYKAKTSGEGSGSFEGYGSVFGNVDSYGDRIVKGAYTDTLPDFLQRGASLLSHDWSGLPLGTIRESHEDDIGLFVASDYHSTTMAQEARTVAQERLERGKNVGLSIGFRAKEWKYVEEDGRDWPVRELIKIDLFELSQVLIPADSYAGMTSVKDGLPFADEADRLLDSAESLLGRTKAIRSLREGRKPSAKSVEQLTEVSAKLNELIGEFTALSAVPPEDSAADQTVKVRQMKMRLLRLRNNARMAS